MQNFYSRNYLHAVNFNQCRLSFRRQIWNHFNELTPRTEPGTDMRH